MATHDSETTAGEAIPFAVGATAVEDTEWVAHCPTMPAGSPDHKAAAFAATDIEDTEKEEHWPSIPAVLAEQGLVRNRRTHEEPWRWIRVVTTAVSTAEEAENT